MSNPLATQFVIADSARARWVRRSEGGKDFVTTREVLGDRAPPHRRAAGVVFESSAGRPASLSDSGDAARRRSLFAGRVAGLINHEIDRGAVKRLAIVASARMLKAILDQLSQPAKAVLVATLARDLTKTPDHQLEAWLRPLETPLASDILSVR
jgi:protein required for attachment to host cells